MEHDDVVEELAAQGACESLAVPVDPGLPRNWQRLMPTSVTKSGAL
jgi:hypothetical protein